MITALKIKHALMSYFRFTRQCICASECLNNDVMVITKDGTVIEVEVKINKYDLWKGEAKKSKHKFYHKFEDSSIAQCLKSSMANKFYICVPPILEEETKKWVKKTNPKYGIIIYDSQHYPYITIIKVAKILHSGKYDGLKHAIMMRVCSENIGLIGKYLIKDE